MKYNHVAKLAKRLDAVKPSATLVLTQKARELAAQGHDVVSLTAGEPDFPPAQHVLDAVKRSLDEGHTRYTDVAGIPELREAIRAYYKKYDNASYEVNEIIVSSGAKQAIFNALDALIDPGDEVIIPAPFWVSYPDMVQLVDGTPKIVETTEREGFILRPDVLEAAINPKTKMLILNSPSNPTGATYSKEQLLALAEVLERHPHVIILSDDIYRRISYSGSDAPTLLSVAPGLQDRLLSVDGASKCFAMTGFRLGWTAGPRNIISAMGRIQGQSTSNAAAPSQYAALAALNGDQGWVQEMVDTFNTRRKFVVGRLRALPGVECFDPPGAFYVFPNVSGLVGRSLPDGTEIKDGLQVAAYLVHEYHVVTVPGTPFGAPNNLRLSFATDMETLTKGLDRMQTAFARLK